MNSSQIIVLAVPFFLLLIVLEFAWGYVKGRNTYRLNDAVNSLSLGMLSQLSAVFTRLLRVGIYTSIYASVALFPNAEFWNHWYGWLLALVFYDFCYYWLHRAGHESAVFWAAHVVHHQSQDYNLSTALRQTSSGALLGWIFYIPMAVAGVPPLLFGIVALIDLLYQFWVHTEHVRKLGWFDRWFCSPSNHRVHHAVNDRYLDRNYGGILIIWDRLFGSFKEEDEKCVYGTRSPLNSWDPLWANTEVYWSLLKDSWHAKNWGDKLRVWFKPPGWRPADVAGRFPKTPFDMTQLEVFHPPLSQTVRWFGVLQFGLLLWGVIAYLWYAEAMALVPRVIWLLALLAGLWSVGGLLQGRLSMLQVLLIESAALVTASAALGLREIHLVLKPLTLLLAMVLVAARARPFWARGRFDAYLLAALAASLAGDVLLMVPGYFIPGLLAFLVAHLFYIALLRQGVAWFPSRRTLWLTLATGLAMYAFLWPSLSPVLKGAVAAYVLVITLMAAQAIGRALVLRDKASVAVAVGAGFFMLSDALLATNRFVQPLPLAQLWVLGTYYVAQILIASHARPVRPSGHKQV
ncbi:lysoplasmalogenase family protein [Polaromonas sp. SM01]|uniref:lysoplasmalogenase family protein n=1 Tax=Polaromonas sp. SM01 TaxID=3085630 RepID=UPI002981E48B|nr:lysoplasmalogenase family protein [Polaromonas sp. SM01]MDW5445102.1 lysoplasmalogenase family protein [Polaromonas sp. SM01]